MIERQIKRNIARNNMKAAKMPNCNKRIYISGDGDNDGRKKSAFSFRWREWVYLLKWPKAFGLRKEKSA